MSRESEFGTGGLPAPAAAVEGSASDFVDTRNDFERQFAQFLAEAEDVRRFFSPAATGPGTAGRFCRVEYRRADGGAGFCYPDWVAVQRTEEGEVHWILETGEREWDGAEPRGRVMRRRCEKERAATGKRWRYRSVVRRDFEAFRRTERSLGGLLVEILLAGMEELREEWGGGRADERGGGAARPGRGARLRTVGFDAADARGGGQVGERRR